jgi:carboxylesterase
MPIGFVLLHGLSGSPTEMRSVGRHLENCGYQIDIPLLPGHGKGTKALLETAYEDWLKGAHDAFLQMQVRCERVFIVGLCASAILAALVAALDKSVAGLALISPHYGKIHPHMPKTRLLLPYVYPFPWLRKKLYWTEGPPYGIKDVRMQQLITTALEESKNNASGEFGTFRTYVESFYQCDRMVRRLRKQAKDVLCPALFLHSLEDSWFAPENSLILANDLGSNDKTVLMFTGCDHVMTVDLRKSYVADQIERFAKEH